MSDGPHDDHQHRRPHTPPMAAPFLEFDLIRELEQLHGERDWNRGQNAKTLVKYDDFRVVLIALKARARLPGTRTKAGSRSRPSPAISWCERKAGRSICPGAPCSHWTRTCLMMLRRLKRARFSSRSRGLVEKNWVQQVEGNP